MMLRAMIIANNVTKAMRMTRLIDTLKMTIGRRHAIVVTIVDNNVNAMKMILLYLPLFASA
jgi:hypothetical protein